MKYSSNPAAAWRVNARGLNPRFLAATLALCGVLATGKAAPLQPVIADAARPLPLSAVRLTGGPLKHAQELDAKYLLELEPDRMMAGYRIRAGLEPKAEGYGGWDAVNSRQLTGHIAGHYLSAVSYMYAATGDPRFKERADYLVKEMKEVQDKQGDGYLGALLGTPRGGRGPAGSQLASGSTNAAAGQGTNAAAGRGRGRGQQQAVDGKKLFEALSEGTIQSGGFDLNGMWSPWYVLHKTFAGLRDAYRYTGNQTALDVEIKFAAWAEKILAPLTDAQIQQMLATEFGGMNEVLADLYGDTGDKRWLALSYKFEHQRFMEPLERHEDRLSGQHGNTAIPKAVGAAARYAYEGDAADIIASSYFWDTIVHHHTFASGGNSLVENFPPADQFSDAVTGGGRTCESCNVYNMLKLTRRLFAYRPDAEYADYEERALFNHVLASIDPTDGWTSYMVPIGQGVRQEYERNMTDGGFTCCVGSGMENHALHGYGVYYENGKELWVNFYTPSTATWAVAGVKLDMATDFPEGETAKLTLTVQSPKEFTLALRRPSWAGTNFSVKVNGEALSEPAPVMGRGARFGGAAGAGGGRGRGGRGGVAQTTLPVSTYVDIKRTWKTGDTVEVSLPKSLRLEPTPDNPERVAILWGPLVLAGDLGASGGRGGGGRRGGTPANVPVLVAAGRPVSEWLKPVEGQPGNFRTDGVGRLSANPDAASDVTFMPFYRTHRRTYGVYWELATPEQWQTRANTVTAAERQRRLEAATVALVQPGEMQSERDFNYQSSANRSVEELSGRHGRAGAGWFSFDVPVETSHPMALLVTLNSSSPATGFRVLVDGTRVSASQPGTSPSGFYELEYAVPANLVGGKQKVTVRFEAPEGGEIAPVFGIRMIRADAQR